MKPLRMIVAQPADLGRYIDLLEDVASWLESNGIHQWPPGNFRKSEEFYAESIRLGEVHLAFLDNQLAGTLRLLLREPIVWPDIDEDDGVYVYNLAVSRAWAAQDLGHRMLEWVENQAALLGRTCVRLDCVADNRFLRHYYEQAGFLDRGEILARFPGPFETLLLQRYEKQI